MVCLVRGELERVAVAAGDQHGTAAPLFGDSRRGEEIVGLETRALGVGKTAGGDEFRDQRELLDQIVVEFAAALIGGKCVMAIGRRLERVPADQHRARLFGALKPQQHDWQSREWRQPAGPDRDECFSAARDRRDAQRSPRQ